MSSTGELLSPRRDGRPHYCSTFFGRVELSRADVARLGRDLERVEAAERVAVAQLPPHGNLDRPRQGQLAGKIHHVLWLRALALASVA